MAETYTINVSCSNCDRTSPAQLAKGVPVPEVVECPNCGCQTAKKATPPLLDFETAATRTFPHKTTWIPQCDSGQSIMAGLAHNTLARN